MWTAGVYGHTGVCGALISDIEISRGERRDFGRCAALPVWQQYGYVLLKAPQAQKVSPLEISMSKSSIDGISWFPEQHAMFPFFVETVTPTITFARDTTPRPAKQFATFTVELRHTVATAW